jgi:uncharacterized membrane protein
MVFEDQRGAGTQGDGSSGFVGPLLSGRVVLLCLLAFLTAGCLIRLHFIGRSMRYDEAWTFLHYASRPLFEGISNYSAPNNHLFHTALVHAVYLLFGNHPWLLRLPALVAGLAIIPSTYFLGAALHCRATGLLAAGFATLSAPLIDYSVNARGYTMMTFFSTAAFAIAVGVMEEPSRRSWVMLAICSILGFFTVPVMAYPYATLLIWMGLCLLTGHSRKVTLRNLVQLSLVVGAGTLILYIPMLTGGGLDFVSTNTTLAHKSWKELIQSLPRFLADYHDFLRTCVPSVLQVLMAAGLGTVLVFRSRQLQKLRLLLPAAVCAPLLIVTAARNWPFPRILIYLLPLYAVIGCAGLVSLWSLNMPRWFAARSFGWVASLIGLLFLANGLVTTDDGYLSQELPNGDEIGAYIAANIRPGDAILAAASTDTPLEYYLDYYHVPFHHVVADESRMFNSYSKHAVVLPDRECWTRLIVVVSRAFNEQTLETVLGYMGQLGPVSTEILWVGEMVKVYGVTRQRPPQLIADRNLVMNSGFESNTACWWTTGSAVLQQEHVRAGSNGLRLGPMRGGVFQPIALKRSTKYQFIVWARLAAGQDVGWTGISLEHSAPEPEKHQCEIRTTDWHECTLTFTTAADLHESMVWAWKNDGPAQVDVDHFRVVEQPE